MKTLYIDCFMGASSDMIAAALLELIQDQDAFIRDINALGIPSVYIKKETHVKGGITGTYLSVTINDKEECVDVHYHEQSHEYGHHHIGLQDIEHIVRNHLELPEKVKNDIIAIYMLIAEATCKTCGKPVTEIYFHEVGTRESLIDIAVVCMLMNKIAPEQVIVSPVHVGCGQVKCAHGFLPVPAPVTAHILQGVPIYGGHITGELCTPTGAAILKYFADSFGEMPVMTTNAIGYGMGKKDFSGVNCVRILLGEIAESKNMVAELYCNIDDMTAEAVSFAMEVLFNAGALEVYTVNVGMKKSRPGILLCTMCHVNDKNKIIQTIFKHTSTNGIREQFSRRYTLQRSIETVDTAYGFVRKKISNGYGVQREKYEYEDIADIARKRGMSIIEVMKELGKKNYSL